MSQFEPLCSSITLDTIKDNLNKMLIVKQGDINSRTFSIKLCSNGVEYKIPDGTTAKYAITRSHNSAIWNDCDKIENDTIFGTFSSESMSVAGVFQMQIELYNQNNTAKFTPYNFLLKVKPSARNADNQVGKNEYGVLDNLIKKATETDNKTNTALETIENLKENLEISETTRVENEKKRIEAEKNREENTQNAIDACNTATNNAIEETKKTVESTKNANNAADRANDAANKCDGVLDKTGVVLTDDKGKPNGVAELDANAKIKNIQINTAFSQNDTREELVSGENFEILLGKIAKSINDLGVSAFCKVVNDLSTTANNTVLDGRQGKILEEKKFDKDNILKSVVISQEGKVMDGKTSSEKFKELDNTLNSLPVIRYGKEMIDDSIGKDGDIFILITEEEV